MILATLCPRFFLLNVTCFNKPTVILSVTRKPINILKTIYILIQYSKQSHGLVDLRGCLCHYNRVFTLWKHAYLFLAYRSAIGRHLHSKQIPPVRIAEAYSYTEHVSVNSSIANNATHSCCDPTVLLSKTTEEHILSKLMRCTNLSHVTINMDAINIRRSSCCLCCIVPRWHIWMLVMGTSLVNMNIFRQVAKFAINLVHCFLSSHHDIKSILFF